MSSNIADFLFKIAWTYDVCYTVSGLCKSTKSTENEDYEDDPPLDEEDEEDEDAEDADNLGVTSPPPQILSLPMSIRVKEGDTVKLPCTVIHAGL